MPIVKRQLGSALAYADVSLYANAPPTELLQHISVTTTTGAIAQLGYLATYTKEVFADLFALAEQLNHRVQDLDARTRVLVATQVERAESKVEEAPTDRLLMECLKGERTGEQLQLAKQQLFVRETMPVALVSRYDAPEVSHPPALQEMDAVLLPETLQTHGPCMEVFSHPKFFFNEWSRQEEERIAKIREERMARRRERKERRRREREQQQQAAAAKQEKHEKRKDLNWRDRYATDEAGAQTNARPRQQRAPRAQVTTVATNLVPDEIDEGDSKLAQDEEAMRKEAEARQAQYEQEKAEYERKQAEYELKKAEYDRQQLAAQQQAQQDAAALMAQQQQYPQQPPPSASPPRPPPPAGPGPGAGQPPPPGHGAPRPPPPPQPNMQPTMQPPLPQQAPQPPMPPPMPAAPRPPPMPQAPPLPAVVPQVGRAGGAAHGALLSSITEGKKLRAVERTERKVDTRDNILSQIRTGGRDKLRHVDAPDLSKKTTSTGGGAGIFGDDNAVSAILARRMDIMGADSDTESDSEEWE